MSVKGLLKNLLNRHFCMYISDLSSIPLIPEAELALQCFWHFLILLQINMPQLRDFGLKIDITWCNHEYNEIILQRNKAWALARSTGSDADWQAFRRLRNICTYMVKRAKSTSCLKNLSDCGHDMKFWKVVKSLKGTISPSFPQQIK